MVSNILVMLKTVYNEKIPNCKIVFVSSLLDKYPRKMEINTD